ncbi:ribonuclease H-like domain-containing protein [Tanacetum coccineum]|uniref:Ribonuclease H-like domain-containing protein n=1 Tax=Tanacetum coccineum TaxID=301880 RepID=A0ABQ5BIV3_9ASTR
MAALQYKDDHNRIAYLGRERGSEDFTDILSYLDHSPLRYALTHDPPVVFDSLVKQFWATATVRPNAAGSHDLVAAIDLAVSGYVTESLIMGSVTHEDANGIFDMQIDDIFAGMGAIGYPPGRTLTFLKHHLSPQWRFLVHTILHCLSPKAGSWNQFPSSIATALICLSTVNGRVRQIPLTTTPCLPFWLSAMMQQKWTMSVLAHPADCVVPAEATCTSPFPVFPLVREPTPGEGLPRDKKKKTETEWMRPLLVDSIMSTSGLKLLLHQQPMQLCMGRIDSLETELGTSKKIMGGAILTLVSRVKKLERTVKHLRTARLVGDAPATEGDVDIQDAVDLEGLSRMASEALDASARTEFYTQAFAQFHAPRSTDVLPHADISESAGPSVGTNKGKAPMPDLEIPAEFLAEDAQARQRLEEEQASARLVQQLQAEDLPQADVLLFLNNSRELLGAVTTKTTLNERMTAIKERRRGLGRFAHSRHSRFHHVGSTPSNGSALHIMSLEYTFSDSDDILPRSPSLQIIPFILMMKEDFMETQDEWVCEWFEFYPIRAPLLERMLRHRLTVPPTYCRDVVVAGSVIQTIQDGLRESYECLASAPMDSEKEESQRTTDKHPTSDLYKMSQPANDEFSQHLSDDEASNHEDASDTGAAPKQQQQVIPQTTAISNIKLPILKKEEYDIWAIEMEHYLEYIDNEVWKVIQNGNSKKRILTGKDGIVRVLSPLTTVEIQAVEKERKAKNILLMAIPKEHMRRFHGMDDAKEIWEAIRTRFGGNANSKKMQKAVFKQQFEAFKISNSEGLEKGYDRFQQLLSQLEAHGAEVSTEDANHKFLRSLPPAWSNLAMTMRTNPEIDTLSIDDLYNNLRVFEQEIQGVSKTSSSAQNVAFVSQSKSSTNKVKPGFSGAYTSCTPSTSSTNIPEKEVLAGFADEVIYSLFAKQTEDLDLLHEDLEQIDDVDIEEMDINWQIAMIAIRMKKFYKKTGRRVRVDGKTPVGFDKKKLECFNCHNTGHFARECTAKGTYDGKKKRDSLYQHQEAGKQEKNQMGLLTMDDGIVNWGEHTEVEETNHALMAISSSNEANEIYEKDEKLKRYRRIGMKAVKEKEQLQKTVDSWKILSVPPEVYVSTPITSNEKGVSDPKSKEVEPSCVSHIKTPRQPIKDQATPNVNRKNWNVMMERELGEGYSFTKKKCFVCGSLSHLIKDCDYYEKKMAREAEVKKQRVFNTGNGVAKPVWTNANRVNHANKLVPRSVQLNAGRPNINTVRPNINTGRTNINPVRPRVNTGSSNVNTVRLRQPVPTRTSNSFSPKRPQDHPLKNMVDRGIFDSGCSGHMTGNKDQLEDFEEFNGWICTLDFDMKTPTPAKGFACLIAKATSDESKLWHRRLDTLSVLGNLIGKSDEGFLVGYSLNSKAYRVYNLVTKRVEVNLHVNFLEDKPNVKGVGYRWMFDIDYLTDSMNYIPVSLENQANPHAGTSEVTNSAGTSQTLIFHASEEKDEEVELIVVPSAVKNTEEKVKSRTSSKNSKNEEILTEPQQEKKVSSTDTSEDNPKIIAFRRELEEIALRHLGTVSENNSTSTPSVNTGNESVNTGRLDPDDSPMPELEIFHKSETGIFDEASYDEEGVITDFNSLPTEIEVSPTPTLRIHNIHPKSQILGDPKSAVQTRSKVQQKSGAHALFSFIQKQQRNNHKDQQHCLFACFLSQEEPKKIAEALQDDSWVQAMQEELLQFKLQQVWVLVDLPHGMKVIGTKWVYRNKRDERGVVVRNKWQIGWPKGHARKEEKHGYKRGTIDKTLFIKRDKKDIMLVQVFQMSSMGELTFFLGLQVKQNKAGIFISQDKYVAEILKKFDLVNVKTAITPMETKVALTKDEEAVDVDVTPKNFTSHACEENLESTLRGKPNLGLWYPRESPFDLEAFSDSDYGGSNLDRNPQHVVCQFLVKTYLNGNARNNQVATCYSLKLNMYCCKIVVDKNNMELQMYDRLLLVLVKHITMWAQSQPSSSTIPVPSTSLPPVQSPPPTPTPIPASTPTPIPASTPTPIPETDPEPMEHTFEEPSPAHQHFSPPQEQAQEQISVDDCSLSSSTMNKVLKVGKDLKQTKLTMGSAIVKLVKKVKKLEGILKRKNVVFSDSEEEEPEDQGRKSQDDPLVSLVQGLVTPSKSTVNISGEEQIRSEYKRRKETKGKKVVTSLDFQEEVNTGAEEVNTAEGVNTGSTKVSTVSGQVSTDSITKSIPSPDKGQREGKAPMIIEEAPKKTKEQILQEEASLAEAIRLDTLEKRMKRQINTLGGHWKAISAEDFRFFKEVKEEFDKLVKQVESFAPINFEATKDSLKRFGEELQTKTSKRLKSDEAKDDEPTKKTGKRRKQMARKGLHTDLDKDDSEDSDEAMNKMILSVPKIPINPVPVAMKSPSIATYKIIKQGERGVYQIVREDGTDIVYINFGAKV